MRNMYDYDTVVMPLHLLCIEIIILATIIAIGMYSDLKKKTFAIWHWKAVGTLFKWFSFSLCLSASLLSLQSLLASFSLPLVFKTFLPSFFFLLACVTKVYRLNT
eukprot:TRINITY_DN5827_c0_g1_i1.p3 TRINITY_DN5827_c0_g1~~TRINITY_DN5827_c0_g1_i1.p3  ORF type:complete len:105 (+),score=15.61 TRINITY_DN5827_c0_g1_i1:406-720(+)